MNLIQAVDEMAFDAALNQLVFLCGADDGLISYMRDRAAEKETFAEYLLRTYEGSMNLRGSSIAEANNSSVLSFIQDLTSARSMDELVLQLLKRQREKEKKTSHLLYADVLKLEAAKRTVSDATLERAASELCHKSYERFSVAFGNMANYYVELVDCIYVVKRKNSDAPGRTFMTQESRCMCQERVAFMMSCVHEIVLQAFLGKSLYEKNKFHRRHYLRTALFVSDSQGGNQIHHAGLNRDDETTDDFFLQQEDQQEDLTSQHDDYTDENNQQNGVMSAINTSQHAFLDVQSQKPSVSNITYAILVNAATECANACLQWKNNEVSRLF